MRRVTGRIVPTTVFPSLFYIGRRFNSTTTGSSGGAIPLAQEPEFEGEANTAAQEGAAATAIPTLLPFGYKPPPVVIPAGGPFHRLGAKDQDEIYAVYNAYCNYFNHMKFRKNWEEPQFNKKDCEDTWMLAAEFVVRLRKKLDEVNPGQKLRMKDGAAQEFFFSPEAAKLGDGTSFEFCCALVHATMRDAIGYVEGLNKQKVNDYIQQLTAFRYNPKIHAAHVTHEILHDIISKCVMRSDTPQAVMELEMDPLAWKSRDDHEYYITAPNAAEDNDDPADKAWRAGIAKLYEAMDELQKAERHMKKRFVEPKKKE